MNPTDLEYQSLDCYNGWPRPVWLFDIERHRLLWANDAALPLWKAADLDELRRLEVGKDTFGAGARAVDDYLAEFRHGRPVFARWTFAAHGHLRTLFCFCSGHALSDGRRAMLVIAASVAGTDGEAGSATATTDKDGLLGHVIVTGNDVTAQRVAEVALRESERKLQEITDVIADGIYVLDANGCITFVNPAAEQMLGWPPGELIGHDAHAVFHYMRPDGREYPPWECAANRAIGAGEVYRSVEDYFIRRDGSWLPVSIVAAPILRGGTGVGSVATFHDIGGRLAAQTELANNEARYRTLFNSSHDAVFVHTIGEGGELARFIEVNDVACERLGYTRDELLAMRPVDIDGNESAANMPAVIARLLSRREAIFEQVHVAKDGRRIPVEISSRVFEYDGRPTVISIARDVSERKQAEERIYQLAHYDSLTGLPNRTLLMDRLRHALAQSRRYCRPLAVLFLDLDDFKQVNDTLGHDAGDELLETVARRLLGVIRSDDTASRMGGDEFIIVVSDSERPVDAERVAEKLIEAVTLPVEVKGQILTVTASVGISRFPEDGADELTLLKKADIAMYRAKRAGKNAYRLFAESEGGD